MAFSAKPFYLFLTVFLFSQIMTALWPKQYLHSTGLSSSIPSSWLWKRSIDPGSDIQCEDVWSHADRCNFVKEYCADYSAGLINYLHFFFCDLSTAPVMAIIILSVWMVFLFGFVGVAASDFFCPNLSTIAKQLHLSESMTGVTFLAFGNGSPDVFSTFSAIGAGSGSLAIGELVGAASFITSVVVGSMAIIKPFKISRAPFLRDVSFFTGCVAFTLFAVMDGEVTLVESLLLVVYYVIYVAFVVIGNWWHQRVKTERELEQRARNIYGDEEDDDSHYEDNNYNDMEEDDIYDLNARINDEEQALLPGGQKRGRSRTESRPPNIITELLTGPYDAYEDEDHDDGGGVQDSISLRPSGPSALRRRPSLLSAMEFNEVVRSLTLSGSRGHVLSYDPSYYGSNSPRPNRPRRSHSTRSVPDRRSSTNSHHEDYYRNHGPRSASPHGASSGDPLTVGGNTSRDYEHRHGRGHSHTYGSRLEVEDAIRSLNSLNTSPRAVDPEEETFDPHFEQALLRQSLILPDHHDPANQHLGHIHHHQQQQPSSPGTTGSTTVVSAGSPVVAMTQPLFQGVEPELALTRKQELMEILESIKTIYFPTLLGWEEKSHFLRFLAVTSIPMVLLLTLTLPVVELCEDGDEDDEESIEEEQQQQQGQNGQSNNHHHEDTESVMRPPKITIGDGKEDIRHHEYDGWSRTATTVQMLLAPIFITLVVASAAEEGYIAIPISLVLGAGLSFVVHRFSTEEDPPRFYGALCF
ncbi:hypothetical protein BX616_007485, partial [Lobosporangium transversale]